MNIGIAGALIGGVLTLLSPCSVMLLPAFFAYAFSDPAKLLGRCGLFYLGLITTLVPMGILAGTVGSFITNNQRVVVMIAGGVIALLGLAQIFGLNLPTFTSTGVDGTSSVAVYLLGTVYGIAGACTGPLLGSVLMLAATGGSAFYGGILLAVFALGMTLPLLLLSFLWSRFERVQSWLRPRQIAIGRWRNTWTQVLSGAFCLGIGIFLVVRGTSFDGGILTASQQQHVETWAAHFTSGIPNWAMAVVAVVILAVLAWWHTRNQKRALSGSSGGTKPLQ